MVDNICYSHCNTFSLKVLRTLSRGFIVLLIFSLAVPLFAEGGNWALTPQVIEVPQGGVIDPSHPGAVSYRGIEEIHFLKGDVVSIMYLGQEYSAFVEVLPGDGGESWILTFPDGKNISIFTSSVGPDSMVYLYRYEEGFFPNPLEEEQDSEMVEDKEMSLMDMPQNDVSHDILLEEPDLTEEAEQPIILVTGRMKQI